ncbi:hypothetical protein CFP56_026392 [Quercus suber]|uniref:RING-type domain-containing protein n=1 Tax=Quercus suber TaxID=58331 RepID=A0AAW0LXN1_QUESU
MRWVEKLEIYERNRPERLTPFDSISIKTVSALLSEDGKVLLRDNGDRFCLFHDLGIPLIYHGALLQKIASVAASARGSRMPIFVDLLRLVKRAIKIPMTIHDVVISFNDEYEVVKFQIGSKVTRMPCSHIYHEKCIFKWLKTSHNELLLKFVSLVISRHYEKFCTKILKS